MFIAIVILFILFKILLFLVGEIIKKLYAISLVKRVDRILGFVLGLLSGIVYMELIIMVLGIIPIGFIQNIYGYVQSSVIASIITKLSLINTIMNSISINDVAEFVKSIVANKI